MTDIAWRECADEAALIDAVAADVGGLVTDALENRGRALLALSGGSSPFPIYEKLTQLPIDWPKTAIFPVDDRLVEDGDPLSNCAALRKAFGTTDALILPLFDQPDNSAAAAQTADARLQALDWPPDLVWLGMGGDGHFASIFPGPDLETAFAPPNGERAVAVRPNPLPPEAPVHRVSLTAPAIAEARQLILTVFGETKKAVLDHAIETGGRDGTPIGRFLATLDRPITIYWTTP